MGGTGKVEGSGCSANSFMIGDGVCDEITNTERCVYDGGDCCLEDKQTHICRKCTCHMDFDESKLNVELDDFEAAIYSSDDIGRFLIVKHVVDVASKMTCSALCFDAMKNGRVEIDSILYFQSSVSRNCSCASFESCLNASHWQTISDELHVTLLKDTEVVGLTKKFLPCSKKYVSKIYFSIIKALRFLLVFQKTASFVMQSTNRQAFQALNNFKLLQLNIARRSAKSMTLPLTSAGLQTNTRIASIGGLAG